MNRSYILIGIITVAVLMSCKNETDQRQEENHSDQHVEQEVDKKSNKSEAELISLNEGEKWKVNEEMIPHIQKSERVFNEFEGNDYSQLSEDMMKHTNKLIQSCTMDGKSHDELHKWLHPHIELIKKLGSVEDDDKAEKLLKEIEASFEVYHKYFK